MKDLAVFRSMKRVATRRTGRAALAIGLAIAALAAEAGISVSADGKILEGNGNPFVMRGVNVAHVWYRDKTPQTLIDLEARKANTVRLVLATGKQWSKVEVQELKDLIKAVKDRKMIAVLEVHDATGYGDGGDTPSRATLEEAAQYWVSVKEALVGQEDYVIINIANEPTGNNTAATTKRWIEGHKNAITAIRDAGLTHALMVDAANWGQDWEGVMRDNAQAIFDHDPKRNVIFSVHMYAVYNSDEKVNSYLTSFVNRKLPIIVGEFGNAHNGQFVDAKAIMARAQQYGLGYLGWSWSGNGGSDAPLDLALGFDNNNLSDWGKLLFNDANGITATAKPATIFGAKPPALPSAPTPTATGLDSEVRLSWPAAANAQTYEVQRGAAAAGPFRTLTTGLTVTGYSDRAVTNGTTYFYKVIARNSAGVRGSAVVSAKPTGTTVTPPPATPSVTATAGDGNVTLRWGAVSGATAYSVQRSASAGGPFSLVASLGGSATSHLDGGLVNGTTYFYRVSASNGSGSSAAASVSATPRGGDVGGGGCSVVFDSSNDWGSGQVQRITLTNTGSAPINGWSISFSQSSDFTFVNGWSGNFSQSGRTLTVTPASWNSTLAPNSSTELGFQMGYSGTKPRPTGFSWQGRNCAVTYR